MSESCTGLDAACPPNARHSASHVCRAAAGDECDFEEKCDGASDACPADVTEVDGSSCEVACTLASQCSAGVCVLSAKRLGLWPTTLEFADTFVGEKTDSQAVTMVNQMAATLEITTIDDSGEFPVFTEAVPPFSLEPGASEELHVAFAPLRSGLRSTSIAITTPTCTFVLPVSGVGIEAGGEGGQGGEAGGGEGGVAGHAGAPAVDTGGAAGNGVGEAGDSASAGQGGAAGDGGDELDDEGKHGLEERSSCYCAVPGTGARRSVTALWFAPLALLAFRRRRRTSALAQQSHDAL